MSKAKKKYEVFNPWAVLGLIFIHILFICISLTFVEQGRMSMLDLFLFQMYLVSGVMPAVYVACCYFIHEMSKYEK